MHIYFAISIGAFMGMLILFMVLSKTLNNIINYMAKLEFLLTKELEFKREALEIRRIFTSTEPRGD